MEEGSSKDPWPCSYHERRAGVTVPTREREREKKMMIKYFTKYKGQFRASGGPSKTLLRLDLPGPQLPTMWLKGKVWVPEEPGRWTGQQHSVGGHWDHCRGSLLVAPGLFQLSILEEQGCDLI